NVPAGARTSATARAGAVTTRAMITILGATGRIGGTAAAELRRRGHPVRAVLRDPARARPLEELGCALAYADLGDAAGLGRAMSGSDAVLAIVPPDPRAPDVLEAGRRLVDALGAAVGAARPRAVVAISDYGAHRPEGTGITLLFHHLEARLRAAPAASIFVRSAEHMHNWARL